MDNPETLATFEYTRHKTKTIQRHWPHLSTQDTRRRETKHKNTAQKTTMMRNTDLTKHQGESKCS